MGYLVMVRILGSQFYLEEFTPDIWDTWGKETEETIEWEKLEISSRKLEIPRENFMQRWVQSTETVWT